VAIIVSMELCETAPATLSSALLSEFFSIEQRSHVSVGFRQRMKPVRLHDVLEKEAKRIAQSLHDEAGQLLATVHLKLDEASRALSPEQQSCVGDLKLMLNRFETELRRLSHELRPLILDDLGLLPALEFLRKGITGRTGLGISVTGAIPRRLPPTIETALYRIIHEALTMAQQAHAREVLVAFAASQSRIQCTIRETGGEAQDRRNGMLAIRLRLEDLSGTLSVVYGPDGDGEMKITIPLQ
jgi:two-component system, NarL family, sensor kinase